MSSRCSGAVAGALRVAAHTRDVNRLVYGLRAHRTAEEENPEFPNFDGDAYMTENYNAREPLSEILDGLAERVSAGATRSSRLLCHHGARMNRNGPWPSA